MLSFSEVRALFLCLLFCLPLFCVAQDPYYRLIDDADGLPSNSVYGLFQDSQGFIWITTDDGLCRYDGHSFKSYFSTSQSSKAGSNIFEDPKHRIWYENFDGQLYFVSGDTLIALQQDSLRGYMRAGHVGNYLYLPSELELVVYDLRNLEKVKNLDHERLGFGVKGENGETKYWISGGFEHKSLDSEMRIGRIPFRTETGDSVVSIAFDYLGKVFVVDYNAPEKGIWYVDGPVLRKFAGLRGIADIQTHAFGNGKIWLGYVRGMEVIDAKTGQSEGDQLYFTDKSISAFLIDREGNHWFGTQNEGLMMVPDFSSKRVGLPSGSGVKRLIQTQIGLVAGSQDGKLLRYDHQTNDFEEFYTHKSGHAIDFLLEDGQTLIEGAPAAGIFGIANLKMESERQFAVKDAIRISSRYLAVCTPGTSGLYRLETGDPTKADPWDSLTKKYPNPADENLSDIFWGRGRAVACKTKHDAIYYATSNGLFVLTADDVRKEIRWKGKSCYGNQLQAVGNRIYALNTQGSLFVIDEKDQLSPIDDLPFKGPYLKEKYLEGRLYLLGRKTLMVLATEGNQLRLENVITGLHAGSVNDMAMLEGNLVLAAEEGLILLNPQQKAGAVPPRVLITKMEIAGKSYAYDSLVEVGYLENDVEIHYSILNYRTGGDFPLYYRINGGLWNKTSTDTRQLMLLQLAPGDYLIEFCLGVPGNPVAAQVHLIIRGPFWSQTWFYLLCLMFFLALVALAIFWRGKIMQRRHARNVEKLELENSLRQSTLTAIRSQMNPHFFFNALNTIQAFIFSDDKRNASNYLGKFSKLTRMVLEMSEKEFVSLSDEIQAITLYLELEKSRFGDEFRFQIEVGPALSTNAIYLPSMIIQPFVENAVKHGLLHLSGLKELRVTFRDEGELLVIEVDDNGIGRRRSEELNRQRQERHQSFGVQANKKRIDILNAGHSHIGVAYTDKYDAAGAALGTTVKITLVKIFKTPHEQ
ncbi:MAG: hypothetical protein RLZZ519_791 [Bacteroidota bacterium]|jgi:hypothetical protein